MRSPTDPVRLRFTVLIVLVALAAPLLGLLARWAMNVPAPASTTMQEEHAVLASPETSLTSAVRIDPASFDDRLWRVGKVASRTETEKPVVAAPPRMPVELLAISARGDVRRANLYDPAADAIVIAEAGERVGRLTVVEVGDDFVLFRDRRGDDHRLELNLGGGADS